VRLPEGAVTVASRLAPLVGWWLAVLSAGLTVSCAPRVVVSLPGGSSTPDPDAEPLLASITARCAGVHTWSAEVAVSGRVRDETARLTVLAGTTDRGDLRLEGLAPFGAPIFVLVATADSASLLFPRDPSLLRGAPTAAVLEALVGLSLEPADLHALLTGCGVSEPVPSAGRAFAGGWKAVDVGPGRTMFLTHTGDRWRLTAARIGSLTVGYAGFAGVAPREVRLVAEDPARGSNARLLLRLSQVEENGVLPREAFELQAPPDARPLTLDELRARGLGGSAS
jgi:hypothetical protein